MVLNSHTVALIVLVFTSAFGVAALGVSAWIINSGGCARALESGRKGGFVAFDVLALIAVVVGTGLAAYRLHR